MPKAPAKSKYPHLQRFVSWYNKKKKVTGEDVRNYLVPLTHKEAKALMTEMDMMFDEGIIKRKKVRRQSKTSRKSGPA